MARSVGGAIAEGLESGLRIGHGLVDRQRQRERQDAADALALEDRGLAQMERRRQRERDDRDQRMRALDVQRTDLAAEAKGLGLAATPDDRQRISSRLRALSTARDSELAAAGGYDFNADERQAQTDLQALNSGQGAGLPADRRVRAVLSVTRRDLADFRRTAGQPSRISQAIDDFRYGLANNDRLMLLAGANTILAPDLARGIGEPSPHGGTIVGKEVEAFDQAPDSTPEDPRVMPRLRVWINDGKKRSAEEEKKLQQWRAANPDAPAEATGYYFAPVTTDRSSRPDAPVKTIGMRDGFAYLDKLRQFEEWMNDPQVSADIDTGLGQMGDERYQQTLAALGVRPQVSTKYTSIPQGGSVLATTTDEGGRVVGERRIDSPTPKVDPGLTEARIGLLEAQAGAARGLGSLRDRTDPNARGGGGRDEDRRIGRLLQGLKEDRLMLDRKRQVALEEYRASLRGYPSNQEKEQARKAYDRTTSQLEAEERRIRQKMEELDDRLNGDTQPSAAPSQPAAAPAKSSPSSSSPPKPAADRFVVGRTYRDGNGRTARYLGNGKWEPVRQ